MVSDPPRLTAKLIVLAVGLLASGCAEQDGSHTNARAVNSEQDAPAPAARPVNPEQEASSPVTRPVKTEQDASIPWVQPVKAASFRSLPQPTDAPEHVLFFLETSQEPTSTLMLAVARLPETATVNDFTIELSLGDEVILEKTTFNVPFSAELEIVEIELKREIAPKSGSGFWMGTRGHGVSVSHLEINRPRKK